MDGGSGVASNGQGAGSADALASTAAVSSERGLAARIAEEAIHQRLFGGDAGTVQLGRYTIVRPLGSGAMGVVYLAEDPELGRRLAIKLLHGQGVGDKDRARFLREAQALALLNHPNVVTIHDVGEHGDQAFIAMEFVKGQTLAEWLGAGRTTEEILDVYAAAGRGLSAAHKSGLVHRDFKPANVIVAKDGRIVVVDFGLARLAEDVGLASELEESSHEPDHDVLGLTLTRTGTSVGTPAYMSPEQFSARPTDARSDQFSFCAALYEGVFGHRPFRASTFAALAARVVEGEMEDPAPSTPLQQRVWAVFRRGLEVDPAQRFASMSALLDALDQARVAPPRPRWPRWVVAASAVAAVAGGLAVLSPDPDAGRPAPAASVQTPMAETRAPQAAAEQDAPPPERGPAASAETTPRTPEPEEAPAGPVPPRLTERFAEAMLKSSAGDHEEALPMVTQLLAEAPTDTEGQQAFRGKVLVFLGQLHERLHAASNDRAHLELAKESYGAVLASADAENADREAYDAATVALAEERLAAVEALLTRPRRPKRPRAAKPKPNADHPPASAKSSPPPSPSASPAPEDPKAPSATPPPKRGKIRDPALPPPR